METKGIIWKEDGTNEQPRQARKMRANLTKLKGQFKTIFRPHANSRNLKKVSAQNTGNIFQAHIAPFTDFYS